MNKYQINLPIPSKGINAINDNSISDNYCAFGTKNITFRDSVPKTRRGYKIFASFPDVDNDGFNIINSSILKINRAYDNSGNPYFFIVVNYMIEDYTSYLSYFVYTNSWVQIYKEPYVFGETYSNISNTICSFSTNLIPSIDGSTMNSPSFVANGLHEYRVTSFTTADGTGTESKSSNLLKVTVSGDITKRVILKWQKVNGAKSYRIYHRFNGGTWYYVLNVSTDSTNIYYDKEYQIYHHDGNYMTIAGDPPTYDSSFIPYGNKVIVLSDTNEMAAFNGQAILEVPAYYPNDYEVAAYGANTMLVAPDEVHKQRFMAFDNNRMWLGGYRNIVRMSHLDKFNYWPTTFVWKMTEDTTALHEFMGEIVVFTENTMTTITGSSPSLSVGDTYKMYKVPVNSGVLHENCVASGDNCLYWINKLGVYRFRYVPTGNSLPECLSEATGFSIKKYIDNISDWSTVSVSYFDGQLRIIYDGTKELIFNYGNEAWEYNEYPNQFRSSVLYEKTFLYASDNIYQMEYEGEHTIEDYQTDNNGPINFKFKSKIFDLGKSPNKKKFVKFFVSFKSILNYFTLNLTAIFDNEQYSMEKTINNKKSVVGWFSFGDIINLSDSSTNSEFKLNHNGVKYNFQYELSGNAKNIDFELYNTTLIAKIKELK